MDFMINPYIGAGYIKFGMSKEEVRKTIPFEVEEFLKVPEAQMPVDAFNKIGIHVHYKISGICEAVEFMKPSCPKFQDKELLGKPFAELRELFTRLDDSVTVDKCGLTSYKFGVGLYAPFAAKEPNDPVEGIIVFEKGYYDKSE